jgi:putative ABC transport system permease protein
MFSLLPMAARNLWRRNRRRTLLTILAVATATVVFCAVMVIPYTMTTILSKADASPRLVVLNSASLTYGIPDSHYLKIAAIPGVVALNRMTWFGGVYDDPRHQFPTMGLDDNPNEIWPEYGMNHATMAAFNSSRESAVVGVATMHRFRWHIGQTIALRSQVYPLQLTFKIAATYDEGPDLTAFMFHRKYLEEALGNPGRTDILWVKCENYAATSRVAAAIDEMFHNSMAETQTRTEKVFMSDFISRFSPLAKLVEGIGVCAVVAIALAVLNATAMSMRERGHEIALLRSLGFDANQILASTSLEAAIVALSGGVFGVLAASAMLESVKGYVPALGPLLSFGMPRAIMGGGLVVALAIGLAAGILPAVVTIRRSVFDELRRVA